MERGRQPPPSPANVATMTFVHPLEPLPARRRPMTSTLTPAEFARKWAGSTRTERAASQEHFIDLCRMLGVPTPNEADPTGDDYAFEKGAGKVEGGDGFADVWKRGHFAWEYKGKQQGPRRPPTASSSSTARRSRTRRSSSSATSTASRSTPTSRTRPTIVHAFTLDDLLDDPTEPLRHPARRHGAPGGAEAGQDARRTDRRGGRSSSPRSPSACAIAATSRSEVAHFLNKLLFCMFAEDAGLLPAGPAAAPGRRRAQNDPAVFTDGLARPVRQDVRARAASSAPSASSGSTAASSTAASAAAHRARRSRSSTQVSRLDWSQVEPAIFGTLFERGLDPSKRSQLGAHYTDRGSIMRLIEPGADGAAAPRLRGRRRSKVEALRRRGQEGHRAHARRRRTRVAVFNAFLDRLRAVRVLDPACGSGNFLYLALQALKDLEREAILWASLTLGVPMQFPQVGPAGGARHRAEPLRRRAGPGGHLDRRDPVDARPTASPTCATRSCGRSTTSSAATRCST